MYKKYIKGTSNSQPSQNLWCGKVILACATFSMLLCAPELYCIAIMWLEPLHTSFFWGQIGNICWDPEGMHSPAWDHPLAPSLSPPPSGLLSACSEPRTPCQSLPQQQGQPPAPHRPAPPCHGTHGAAARAASLQHVVKEPCLLCGSTWYHRVNKLWCKKPI